MGLAGASALLSARAASAYAPDALVVVAIVAASMVEMESGVSPAAREAISGSVNAPKPLAV